MGMFSSLPQPYDLGRQLQRRLTFAKNLDTGGDSVRVPFPPGRSVASIMDAIVGRLRAKKLDNVTLYRGSRETDKEASLVVEEQTGPLERCWVVVYAVRRGTDVTVELFRGAPRQPLNPRTLYGAGHDILVLAPVLILAYLSAGTLYPRQYRFVVVVLGVPALCVSAARAFLSKPASLGERMTAHQDRLLLSCKMAVQDAL